MSAGEWIEWKGGACPVPPETPLEIRVVDGQTGFFTAAQCSAYPDWWSDQHGALWIAAYRALELDRDSHDGGGVGQ